MKAMLDMMLMIIIPAKKKIIESLFFAFVLLNLKSKYPMSIFNNPHSTFTVGDDNPFPAGCANGVGNGLPEIPLTKCGITFVRNSPANNAAM